MSADSVGTMDERIEENALWFRLVLRLNRWVFTGAILGAAYVALVAYSLVGPTPLRTVIESHGSLELVFSAFIGAIITGTSIVVTINQLVLSQELGAVGDQRERMQESMQFRRDVEEMIQEGASPPEPSMFLHELVDGIEERANELEELVGDGQDEELVGDGQDEELVGDGQDEELREMVRDYVETLVGDAEPVKDTLKDAQFGTFDVIWAALNFNYSRKIYDARQIRAKHGESLSEEGREMIDDTIQLLQLFGPAREHFKTLYFQWELINLSRALLYVSVPALTVIVGLVMYVDGTALPGTTLGIDNLVWLTSVGFVVGIAPFVVFMSYVLRIVGVAKRTLAMGPFILRETERESDVES